MSVTPIFRMFDEAETKRFYVTFLGFTPEWEHRFEPKLPLYMSVVLGRARLHLSQHHGDCCPGGHVRIDLDDVFAFQRGLAAKDYPSARPGPPEIMPWGHAEVTVTDPAGNRLTFSQPVAADGGAAAGTGA